MKNVKTYGIIKDNQLHLTKRNEFFKTISNAFKEGDRLIVTAEKIYRKRTTKENAYYWVLVDILYDHLVSLGWDDFKCKEDVHELLKYKLLKKDMVNKQTGEVLDSVRTTTQLSTVEMMEYIEDMKTWCAEMFGLNLPEPNEQVKLF